MIKKKKFLEECKILPGGIHKVEQTPSEKMQDELEPIIDEPNYRVGDFLDEVRNVEKMNKIRNK